MSTPEIVSGSPGKAEQWMSQLNLLKKRRTPVPVVSTLFFKKVALYGDLLKEADRDRCILISQQLLTTVSSCIDYWV